MKNESERFVLLFLSLLHMLCYGLSVVASNTPAATSDCLSVCLVLSCLSVLTVTFFLYCLVALNGEEDGWIIHPVVCICSLRFFMFN